MKLLCITLLYIPLSFGWYQAQDGQKPYSNPNNIYGSSFGNFFQALYKTGKYDDMLKFTSSETKKKFGNSALLELYSEMEFGYSLKLKSSNKNKDSITTLNYEAMINATKTTVRIKVKIENDSCKVVLSSLDRKNPFN